MNLFSAGSISLESTFNQTKNNGESTSEAYCRFFIFLHSTDSQLDQWLLCIRVQRYLIIFDKMGNQRILRYCTPVIFFLHF